MNTPRLLRNALFQVHWFVGITAGLVLALVGITGAVLGFEHEIQDRLNRAVRTVTPAGTMLSAPELLARIHQQFPERRIQSLQLEPAHATHAARVTFAPAGQGKPAPGRPRGEVRFVDPYTGTVNADPGNRGEQFFRGVMQLHRWLTWRDLGNQAIGKQIVGAATALCLYLALSGLYLRWPARGANWRIWLQPNFKLSGRAFLWNLHAVIGTWVLAFYVLMSLTGLQWSYEWYRKGLYSLAGVPMPARPQGGERGGQSQEQSGRHIPAIDTAWQGFVTATRDEPLDTISINLPRSAKDPVEIRYLAVDAAHERAMNTIALDPLTGEIREHERYADKSIGGKLVASIFPLHSGTFFGVPGQVLYLLASLMMPVFTVTGWLLYLRRRRAKEAASARASQLASVETG
ncbi:MAG: PepSY-associated TM helix domain-containing protein [Steroidobacteraceae bacterium]